MGPFNAGPDLDIGATSLIIAALILCLNTIDTLALECYHSIETDDPSTCNTTRTCLDTKACFVSAHVTNDGRTVYHLGCTDQVTCNTAAPSLIGKRSTLQCKSCCNSNKCNSKPCTIDDPNKQTAITTCVDQSVQCSSTLSTAICASPSLAQSFCPRTCGRCPLNGGWGAWSGWTACSQTCGPDASRLRMRMCNKPSPQNGGTNCSGDDIEFGHCTDKPCVQAIDGHWSGWSAWFPCTVTCGTGVRLRSRTCSEPYPQNGGKPCSNPASFKLLETCVLSPCSVGPTVTHNLTSSTKQSTSTTQRVTSIPPSKPTISSSTHTQHTTQPTSHKISTTHQNPASASIKTSPATLTSNTRATSPPHTSPAVNTASSTTGIKPVTSPLTSSISTVHTPLIGCIDEYFCTDSHMQNLLCTDVYAAAKYCPKQCGLCGKPEPTIIQCVNSVGGSCNDKLYLKYACADKALSALCAKACGVCT